MTTTGLNIPNLEIVANTDEIATCNVCGQTNYVWPKGAKAPEPNGTKLWDLRTSPNGFQTYVMKYCRYCLIALNNKVSTILKEES